MTTTEKIILMLLAVAFVGLLFLSTSTGPEYVPVDDYKQWKETK